jgi:hypothetical protein
VILLRFSSVKGEADQNAAWLSSYMFNKDNDETIQNNKRKKPKQTYLVQTNTETGTITHEKHSIWFPIRENDKHLP